MTTPYRLKHIPTGLYLDYRHGHCLTSVGKIYISGVNGLNYDKYYQEICLTLPSGRYQRCKKSDFQKELFVTL